MKPQRLHHVYNARDPQIEGPVVYWMGRERRVADNPSLLYARSLAQQRNVELHIVFCLVPTFLDATIRQYGFMLRGLKEVDDSLRRLGLGLRILLGTPETVLIPFLHELRPSLIVTDFEPLRIKRQWQNQVSDALPCSLAVVDSHNIVPVTVASPKQEYAAATLRPKLRRLLDNWYDDMGEGSDAPWTGRTAVVPIIDWSTVWSSLHVNTSVPEVDWLLPGEKGAQGALQGFLRRLDTYAEGRNDPTVHAQSDLSPYLHFGQISAGRIVREVRALAAANPKLSASSEAFLEELIVRRELADNFTHYNDHYDSFDGLPSWAQQTLNEHRSDRRDYLYSQEQWEAAITHDELWNAAQQEMMRTGKMHGYMRMYWAKKILEWSASPEEAMATAIYLNDKYELDGRDPNGYVGVAWSIGGLHDRPWFERPVYGKIRYMNAAGCARKFDVKAYIRSQSSNALFSR